MPVLLLADTLTFLAFLHAHDIRPRGPRWLPPSALVTLNPQLFVRDQVDPASRPQGGRIGTTERDTQRLRFIHFLCEAAHLVARTGPYLKPTLRVQRWLNAAPLDQLRQLFTTAYPDQPSRSHDNLWRTYRLPGWSLTSPTLSLIQPLIHLLRAAPPDEKIKLTTLLKLIPLPADGDELPTDILRGLLDQLAALGILDWHGSAAIRLTEIWTSLIFPNAPYPAFSVQPVATLQLAGKRYLLAHIDCATLYQLADYAELVSVTPPRRAGVERRYQLERSLIQRALQRGHTLDDLLRFLEHALGDALPDRLAAPLRQWAAELDRVSVRRVTLLEVKDPAALTELTRSHRVRECIQRTLSPRAIVIRETRLPALLRQLNQRGLTPRVDPVIASRTAARQSPTRLFDNPSIAQLYFAALLNQHLADHLPAPYRVDYSLVLELERQLTPADQLLARQLVVDALDLLRPAPQPPAADETWPGTHSTEARRHWSIVAALEQAIAAETPLDLTYYSPAYDQTTRRIVEPLRLEWHGDVPYLMAYCRLRQDERTFRVDRIADLVPTSDPLARSKKAA